jgi:uncharacterized coiled-coil DUF342 family protein
VEKRTYSGRHLDIGPLGLAASRLGESTEGTIQLPNMLGSFFNPIKQCEDLAQRQRRVKTITEMCQTTRHDYGFIPPVQIDETTGGLVHNWMTSAQREALFNEMAQLYDHHVAPLQKQIDSMNATECTQKSHLGENFRTLQAQYRELFGAVNQAAKRIDLPTPDNLMDAKATVKAITDHVMWLRWAGTTRDPEATTKDQCILETKYEALQKQVAIITDQRTRLSEALVATGSKAEQERNQLKEEIKKLTADRDQADTCRLRMRMDYQTANKTHDMILGKLGLKHGTPVEVVLDTIQSIQQHANQYRAGLCRLSLKDTVVETAELDRLLEIERGWAKDRDDAMVAGAALQRAHNDINTFASEAGFPSNATADGSRQETLRQVLAHILAMESEVRHLKERNTRQEQSILLIAESTGLPKWPEGGAPTISEIANEIQRLREADKPVYGPSPLQLAMPATVVLIRIAKQVGFDISEGTKPIQLIDEICDEIAQIQHKAIKSAEAERLLAQVGCALEDAGFKLADRKILPQQVSALAQQREERIAKLREIVVRKAPHTGCVPQTAPEDRPCNCWKAEFMAIADAAPEE